MAVLAERDRWIRLFNRLDAAVSRHRQSPLFKTEADDALYAAHDRVMKEACRGAEAEPLHWTDPRSAWQHHYKALRSGNEPGLAE